MTTIPTPPSPTFNEQDAVHPIPNLDPSRLNSEYTRLTFNYPLLAGDLFIMTLNSTVIGGTYNQSFNIAQNTTSLAFLIPTSFVVASAGTTVELRARYQRGFLTRYAQIGQVNINRLPIIVPTPGTVWDFSNGFQGWVAQGPYTGGLLHVLNSTVRLAPTHFTATRAHIITRPVPVVAGRTYDCSFVAIGSAATSDGSILYMTMNGTRIGANVQNLTVGQPQTGTGTFTATTTGDVRLGIFNDAVPDGLHGLSLSNIRMTPRP